MQQAVLEGGADNQFAVDVQRIRPDCATRVAPPPSQTKSLVNQSADKQCSEVVEMSEVIKTENPSNQAHISESTSPGTSLKPQDAMLVRGLSSRHSSSLTIVFTFCE